MSDETVAEPAEVAAHTIMLRRGNYCVYVVGVAPGIPATHLPGLAISAAPGEENAALEVARFAGEQWLRQRGDAVLVRVHAQQVRVLLTSYNMVRIKGAAPPRIEIQRLDPLAERSQAPEVVTDHVADLVVHVRTRGDLRGEFGQWIGEPAGGELWIEGFAIAPPPGALANDLEYQAVLGKGWMSPWVKAGSFCGSRGMRIPIQGLRLRLNDGAEQRIQLALSMVFADGTVWDEASPGEVCALDPLQPVTALRIEAKPVAAVRRPVRVEREKVDTAPVKRRRYVL